MNNENIGQSRDGFRAATTSNKSVLAFPRSRDIIILIESSKPLKKTKGLS
jgi:hypothetical protein